MKKTTLKKTIVNLLGIAVVVVFVFLFSRLLKNGSTTTVTGTKLSATQLENFAKYLTEKGAIMYGTYWCSHCQNQKKLFGDAFKYINYMECTKEPNRCVAAGINGYPTWTIPKSASESGLPAEEAGVLKLEGEVSLENLAKATDYAFPPL